MKLLRYLREVFLSSLPLLAIIILVTAIFPFKGDGAVYNYLKIGVGYVMVLVGQAVFLTGLDTSILPVGKLVGGSITKLNKIVFILLFGFLFGLVATMAEPAIQVMASQVSQIAGNINNFLFLFIVGFGTGVTVAFAIYRIIKNINIRIVFLVLYILIFTLVFFAPPQFQALAFDASGATTGDVSVPFILALGLGISRTASKSKTNDESFGILGIASVGSIIAVFIYGIIIQDGGSGNLVQNDPTFLDILTGNLLASTLALIPIVVVFLIFQFLFIKLPKKKIVTILLSSLVVFVGLFVFLFGVDFGFAYAGKYIGRIFISDNEALRYALIPICFVLGFAITLTEPAVVVLGEQVEEITNGFMKKTVIKLSLALSIGLASIMCICKVLFNIPFLVFMIPLYATALVLMFFTPKLFVGLAFDSGGVTGGAITSAFLTPLILGVSGEMYGASDLLLNGFGMIAFISVTPLIIIQILGIMYEWKIKKVQDLDNKAYDDEIDTLLTHSDAPESEEKKA